MIYLAYILPILFYCVFLRYQYFQFQDMETLENWLSAKKKWHPYGAFMRALLFVPFYFLWKDIILCSIICEWIWELGMNKYVLKQDWLYLGKSDYFDKSLGKYKWIGLLLFLISAIILRIL